MATIQRPIRVDPVLWDRFGAAAQAVGSDRTKVLIAFMRRFVDAMAVRPIATEANRSADADQGPDLPPSAP